MAGGIDMRADRKTRVGSRTRRGLAAALALGGALAIAAASCSLADFKHDACATDAQCAGAFGAGSKCQAGYCTDPKTTTTMTDCNKTGADGKPCYGCAPATQLEFHTACTGAACQPFDNAKRLTKLTADGGLPPLP